MLNRILFSSCFIEVRIKLFKWKTALFSSKFHQNDIFEFSKMVHFWVKVVGGGIYFKIVWVCVETFFSDMISCHFRKMKTLLNFVTVLRSGRVSDMIGWGRVIMYISDTCMKTCWYVERGKFQAFNRFCVSSKLKI